MTDVERVVQGIMGQWGLTHHTAVHALRHLGRNPGWRLTSGYRSARRNREVGGVPESLHLVGAAFDTAPKGRATRVDYVGIRRELLSDRCDTWCTGLSEVVAEDDHVHAGGVL